MALFTTIDDWRVFAGLRGYTAPDNPPTPEQEQALQRANDYIAAEYFSQFATCYKTIPYPTELADAVAIAASHEADEPFFWEAVVKPSEETYDKKLGDLEFGLTYKPSAGDVGIFVRKNTLIESLLKQFYIDPNCAPTGAKQIGIVVP